MIELFIIAQLNRLVLVAMLYRAKMLGQYWDLRKEFVYLLAISNYLKSNSNANLLTDHAKLADFFKFNLHKLEDELDQAHSRAVGKSHSRLQNRFNSGFNSTNDLQARRRNHFDTNIQTGSQTGTFHRQPNQPEFFHTNHLMQGSMNQGDLHSDEIANQGGVNRLSLIHI